MTQVRDERSKFSVGQIAKGRHGCRRVGQRPGDSPAGKTKSDGGQIGSWTVVTDVSDAMTREASRLRRSPSVLTERAGDRQRSLTPARPGTLSVLRQTNKPTGHFTPTILGSGAHAQGGQRVHSGPTLREVAEKVFNSVTWRHIGDMYLRARGEIRRAAGMLGESLTDGTDPRGVLNAEERESFVRHEADACSRCVGRFHNASRKEPNPLVPLPRFAQVQ